MRNPSYETDEEFDDGGTPMWRARQTPVRVDRTTRPTITIPAKRPSLWSRLSVAQVFLIGYLGPLAFLFFAFVFTMLYLIIHDSIVGHP